MNKKGLLIVVSGFSGVGKGTLIKELMRRYSNYVLSVSMTTREPREGELEGREYFFRTRDEFEALVKEDGFLEHAEYIGNCYGTPKAFVENMLSQGMHVLLEIEVQGALQIKKKFPESVLLYVVPPDAHDLKSRLLGRATEDDEHIKKRLERAVAESDDMEKYDYIVVNDVVEKAAEKINMIAESACLTCGRNAGFIERLRRDIHEIYNK